MVAVLKLKNCDILKGSLAQTSVLIASHNHTNLVYGSPGGPPMKIAVEVYYVKSMGTNVMTYM